MKRRRNRFYYPSGDPRKHMNSHAAHSKEILEAFLLSKGFALLFTSTENATLEDLVKEHADNLPFLNELRLNFIDPKAQETLQESMREFLELTTPE